jgi:hypothetical protein
MESKQAANIKKIAKRYSYPCLKVLMILVSHPAAWSIVKLGLQTFVVSKLVIFPAP